MKPIDWMLLTISVFNLWRWLRLTAAVPDFLINHPTIAPRLSWRFYGFMVPAAVLIWRIWG